MWCNHLFSQKHKTRRRAVWVEVGGYGEVVGGRQDLKKMIGNKGALHEIGWVKNPLPTMIYI